MYIQDWKCGSCKKKILGKYHADKGMIIRHKQYHIEIIGTYQLKVYCPFCGGENIFTREDKRIEELVNGTAETTTRS